MIPAFRNAICALGSGTLLIAAAAFSRDDLLHRQFFAELQASAADAELANPAEIDSENFAGDVEPISRPMWHTRRSWDDDTPSIASANTSEFSSAAPSDVHPSAVFPSAVYHNASLRSAAPKADAVSEAVPPPAAQDAANDTTKHSHDAASPVVVLKPEEKRIASRERFPGPASDQRPASLVTRIYHPITISVIDLERLVRPLLTPGVGTAIANERTASDDGPADAGQSVLLVRDRPEIVSQIDTIYADLEAAPKRVVIDAVIADIALADAVPAGWQLSHSHFGVIDAGVQSVVASLRTLGRVSVIATNQLQVIDRQWAQLEWTEGSSQMSAFDRSLRMATRFRIRPSVLAGGTIRLEVHPTSSRLKDAATARPQLATVAFTTDIMLHDGSTALIAGSIDERTADANSSAGPAIHPQPTLRHETVLLLMPRISRAD
jgi:type II secretory pathway component GspD/PulD (secretin)